MYLQEMHAPVHKLKGVGKATSAALFQLGIRSVADLLTHYPREYEDRKNPAPLNTVYSGGKANTIVEVVAHDYFGRPGNKTLKVFIRDETAAASLVCFGRNFLARKLQPGMKFYVYGDFYYKYNELQSSSFEFEPYSDNPVHFGAILPIYPLSSGLNQKFMRNIAAAALQEYGKYAANELPEKIRKRYGYLSKKEALKEIHFPETLEKAQSAQAALVYEELFYLQVVMGREAVRRKQITGKQYDISYDLQKRFIKSLPFELTEDQVTSLNEINSDIVSASPMARLLQGDVGSGKTLIALCAALSTVEAGKQVAFMAPTELLAKQHAENAAAMLEPLGIRLAFLSGTVQKEARNHLEQALEAGEIDILIGTHALFSRNVRFKSLGLVVVDEQQRFGVMQRMALMEKGDNPDLLLMTATPIPRTLALTFFSDLDISTIKTMPPGRKPIQTHLAKRGNEYKVYERVRQELEKGRQAYFVYPLIQQSEKLSVKDAESAYHALSIEVFPDKRLGLIHSKISEEEKLQRMHAFKEGKLDMLVATSVVEVGVDVTNATCMVIEHAERFGLSALHQLRGRVGRGPLQSYAFLVFDEQLTEEGKQRLKVIMNENDGFVIAAEDLKIRGPGNVLGTEQSGYMRLTIADLGRDTDTLVQAREDAFAVIRSDSGLIEPENKVIREVLDRASPFNKNIPEGG